VLNELDVEDYLKGMGEVRSPSWPPAGLRAQAIAARTYALRAMSAAGEICADQRCQVYLGAQAEYPEMNKAVADTAGQVLTYRNRLASTVYSANAAGVSASILEGFGPKAAPDDAYPYLRAAPYPVGDRMPWSVTVALADLGARLGYRGEVSGVAVSQTGPSGRVLEVIVDGSAGPLAKTGLEFKRAIGLKSNLFTLRVEEDGEPPPPPPVEPGQIDPGDGAGLLAAAGPAPTAAPAPAPDPRSSGGAVVAGPRHPRLRTSRAAATSRTQPASRRSPQTSAGPFLLPWWPVLGAAFLVWFRNRRRAAARRQSPCA
jgi:stage II sporulation protein D